MDRWTDRRTDERNGAGSGSDDDVFGLFLKPPSVSIATRCYQTGCGSKKQMCLYKSYIKADVVDVEIKSKATITI